MSGPWDWNKLSLSYCITCYSTHRQLYCIIYNSSGHQGGATLDCVAMLLYLQRNLIWPGLGHGKVWEVAGRGTTGWHTSYPFPSSPPERRPVADALGWIHLSLCRTSWFGRSSPLAGRLFRHAPTLGEPYTQWLYGSLSWSVEWWHWVPPSSLLDRGKQGCEPRSTLLGFSQEMIINYDSLWLPSGFSETIDQNALCFFVFFSQLIFFFWFDHQK